MAGPVHALSPRPGPAVPRRALLVLAIAGALATLPGMAAAANRPSSDPDTAAAADVAASGTADASPYRSADYAEFDQRMLPGAGQSTIDLSRFERANAVLPGTYRVDIYLNDAFVGQTEVRFAAPSPQANALPCVTTELMQMLGLLLDKLPPERKALLGDPNGCVDLATLVPAASLSFDQPRLRLNASVPQAWLAHQPRGYVAPEYWDEGVPALLLNYNLNGYRSRSAGHMQTFGYLGLNAGVNLGAWHLRHHAALNWQGGRSGQPAQRRWQNIDSYVQRDLPAWRAQLTLGDAYTSGELFDSVRLRGVRLATDDRMLPDSLRGYAPTVRGVAESNARVSIRQNGVVIYEATVAPGPFVIDDLYTTSYGGDLEVSVTEADGRVRTIEVPYAAVPQLLRPGITRFAVTAGELSDSALRQTPFVAQATAQRGFSNLLTGYAGLVGSTGYASALLGTALNTRYGALALDLTGARTDIPGQASKRGQSLRLSYSKTLPQTDTSLTVATYRYSTSGYLGLRDALLVRDYARDPFDAGNTGALLPNPDFGQLPSLSGNGLIDPVTGQLYRQRSRFDISLNQRLGDLGALYVSASARDYWNRRGTDVQYQVSYNNRLKWFGYSLSASRARDTDGRYRNEYFLSFSLPLGESAHAPNLNGNLGRDVDGHINEQLTLSGTAGEDNRFNYGATASHSELSGDAGSAYGSYRGSHGQLSASYGAGTGYTQASVGATGSVVAYSGGIGFGQPTGETVAIVVAPHAAGARVSTAAGLRLDHAGRAIVPYLIPYHQNIVQLDPQGVSLDVQLQATSIQVAPHAGAVVLLPFKTTHGRSLIVRISLPDGSPAPFGAEVLDTQGQVLGVVGQAGRSLLRGVDDAGELAVRWQGAAGTAQTCTFRYQAPQGDGALDTLHVIGASCQASRASVAGRSSL